MLPRFVKLLVIAILSFSQLSALAEGATVDRDHTCSNILDVNNSYNHRIICNDDLIATSLSMLFTDAYANSNSIRSSYDSSGLPSPTLNIGHDATEIHIMSKMVTSISVAMMKIFYFLALPFFTIAILLKSVEIMKEESIGGALKKPEVWGSSLYFMTVAILVTVNDGFMVGHTLVLFLAGTGLAFGNQLLSSIIHTFDASTEINEPSKFSYDQFMHEGYMFASEIITGTQVVTDSVSFMDTALFHGTSSEERVLKSDYKDEPFNKTVSDAYNSKEELTIGQVAAHRVASGSVRLMQQNPIIKTYQGRSLTETVMVRPSVNHAHTLSKYRAQNGIGVRPLIDLDNKLSSADDVFDKTDVFVSSVLVPTVSPSEVEKFSRNGFFKVLSNHYLKNDHDNLDTDQGASDYIKQLEKVAHYIRDDVDEADRQSIYQMIPLFMLGYSDESVEVSLTNNVRTTWYNPADVNGVESGSMSPAQEFILNHALKANRHTTAATCATALMFKGGDGEKDRVNVLQDIHMAREIIKNSDNPWSGKDLKAEGASFQCFYSNNGSPESVLHELFFSADTHPLFEVEPSDDLSLEEATNLILIDMDDELERFAQSHMALARDSRKIIASVYAISIASTGRIAMMSVEAGSDDVMRDSLIDIRKKGAGALHSYFFQLGAIMREYREAYGSVISANVDSIFNVDVEYGVGKFANENLISSAWNKIWGDTGRKDAMQEAIDSHVSTELMQRKGVSGDDAVLAYMGSDDTVSDEGMFTLILDNVMQFFFINSDILQDGFGFDNNSSLAQNFKDCFAITNCININGHPMLVITEFGKDMFYRSLNMITLDFILRGVLIGAVNDLGNPDSKSLKGKAAAILFNNTPVGSGIMFVLNLVGAMTKILANFSKVLLLAGLMLGYILPVLPLLTGLFLWAGWIFEVLIIFVIFPLIAFLAMARFDGKSLISFSTLASMLASIVIRPMLFVVSFLGLFSLSYVMFYLVNSVAFQLVSQITGGDLGVWSFVSRQLSLAIIVFIYYKVLTKVNNDMAQVPEHVCSYMGVKSFGAVAATGIEQLIAGKAIGDAIKGALPQVDPNQKTSTGTEKKNSAKGGKRSSGSESSEEGGGSPNGESAGSTKEGEGNS
ncbi:membrane hypothetical protein [Vibrio chagasii]|nr:membrane hypothetical protein [Vibrio chagasii]